MVRNQKHLLIYGLLTLAMMGLIFFMSSKDGTESGSMSEWLLKTELGRILMKLLPRLTDYGEELDIRKYAHMAEYALLSMPSALFFRELLLERFPVRAVCSSLLFCFLYACSDEYHQTFVPGRAGTLTDVFVDLAGAGFGLVLVLLSCVRRKEMK